MKEVLEIGDMVDLLGCDNETWTGKITEIKTNHEKDMYVVSDLISCRTALVFREDLTYNDLTTQKIILSHNKEK